MASGESVHERAITTRQTNYDYVIMHDQYRSYKLLNVELLRVCSSPPRPCFFNLMIPRGIDTQFPLSTS